MTEDISNKTIVVLVLLTVVISILGTVVVLDEVSNADDVVPQQSSIGQASGASAQGEVRLKISKKAEPQIDTATGYVTLKIV